MIDKELLKTGANDAGIEINDYQLQLFSRYAQLLIDANKHINLTRIIDPDDIVKLHYLDSLICLSVEPLSAGMKVIDIGTGAGLPGIPIAIVSPDVEITLVDATNKKTKFLSDTASELELKNVRVVCGRAEELGQNLKYRKKFDVVYARALSKLNILAELCLPFARIGGSVVSQKSAEIDEEIKEAKPIIGQLGGRIDKIGEIKVPETDIMRKIIIIGKIKKTPMTFPRPFSIIKKSQH